MRIFIFLLAFSNLVFGISLNLKEKILLDPKNNILQNGWGIALLDDGSILFSDGSAGDFKIFDGKGKLIRTFGRKGKGPNEFDGNYLLGYRDGHAVIMNRGGQKLVLYKITNKLEFIEEQSFRFFAFDASIADDTLLITRLPEYDPNQTFFTLFALNLKTKKMSYLIPTRLTFGEKPVDLKLNQTSQMQDVLALGIDSYCDRQGKSAFMVWRGNWQVMKVDMDTKKITRFGNKPKNYVQPYVSKELKNSRKALDQKSCQSMSWMVDVITWKDLILIFYITYDRELTCWQTYVQIYNDREELLLEKKLDGFRTLNYFVFIHMNKKSGQIIGLAHFLDADGEDLFQVLKYEIN